VSLAQKKPKTIPEFNELEGIGKNVAGRFGKQIIEAIARGLDHTPQESPVTNEFPGDKGHLSARVDLALAYMKGKCIAEGIDHSLVATRAEVTALVQDCTDAKVEDHRLLNGWRYDFVGKNLLQLISGELSVRMDAESGLPIHVTDTK